jgi:quinoprotein dehydrogenase-associated probable ABC transporter substrate-binding protein
MIKKRSTFLAAFSVGACAAALAVCAGCALAATLAPAPSFAQALERPQSSLELIDPKALSVCADPHNMPFSTEKGEGFENKVAELLAGKLGRDLSYTWYPQAPGFVRNTLAAHRCDVIMGVPQGDDMVQVTNPYYRTAYALVFKQGQGLEGVDTLGDPRLKGKRIGIVAGTPPGSNMTTNGLMANAKPYPLVVDTRVDSSGAAMMRDLEAGDIDVGVLWGPMAGYYGQQARSPRPSPLVKQTSGPRLRTASRWAFASRSGLEAFAQPRDWGESAGHQQAVAELWSPAPRRQRSPHHRGADREVAHDSACGWCRHIRNAGAGRHGFPLRRAGDG